MDGDIAELGLSTVLTEREVDGEGIIGWGRKRPSDLTEISKLCYYLVFVLLNKIWSR